MGYWRVVLCSFSREDGNSNTPSPPTIVFYKQWAYEGSLPVFSYSNLSNKGPGIIRSSNIRGAIIVAMLTPKEYLQNIIKYFHFLIKFWTVSLCEAHFQAVGMQRWLQNNLDIPSSSGRWKTGRQSISLALSLVLEQQLG